MRKSPTLVSTHFRIFHYTNRGYSSRTGTEYQSHSYSTPYIPVDLPNGLRYLRNALESISLSITNSNGPFALPGPHCSRCSAPFSRVRNPISDFSNYQRCGRANKNCRCYSAYEHSTLSTLSPPPIGLASQKPQQLSTTSLPLDISLETILSVVLICIGLVLGAEELKPIIWRVWAGKVEKESGGGGPYQGLEDRLGFVDIRVGCSLQPPLMFLRDWPL